MAGLSSAVDWWEEWQMRILVLSSLGIQCYLAFFAGSRKFQIRLSSRISIWLAYLGGDAVAIYALATLFNRQKKLQFNTGSHDLEVLWAPVLLIHLGGQINISAYNIEDNELWRRHILTVVSQVAVALYVFCKSWSHHADKRLLAAAILLFILGVLKCFQKPIALKNASFNNLVSSFHPAPRTEATKREVELEEYVQEAKEFVCRNEYPPALGKDARLEMLSLPNKLFVDSAYACKDHLSQLKSFWSLDGKESYEQGLQNRRNRGNRCEPSGFAPSDAEVKQFPVKPTKPRKPVGIPSKPVGYRRNRSALCKGLSETFDLTYTRIWQTNDDTDRPVSDAAAAFSYLVWLLNVTLPIVPIALFHSSRKEAYREGDIKVTFILLYITYLLELVSFISWGYAGYQWPDMVAQHSLIDFLSCRKRHTKLMGIAERLQCKGLFEQYISLKPCHSFKDITNLVRSHIKNGWTNYISDVESYWKFTDMRGQWTLKRNGCEETLRGSLEKPFDESILLWHVATDFCFHCKSTSCNIIAGLCREISNYMVHLLFANPEMLMPGTRRSLFADASNELEAILQGKDISSLDEKEIAKLIVDKEGIIPEAWVLAQELMQLGDDKMWEVIKGVWIDMLCFSACRCRGYLHIKSLGFGGEYLTFVSLLMSHAGLETFVARQQRVQLRLPKEARLHIVKIRTMKEEIIEAVRKRKEKVEAAKEGTEEAAAMEAGCASPKVEESRVSCFCAIDQQNKQAKPKSQSK
ncbi:hypothetical protein EJB05_09796, partial [Eragrostis curvula]